MEGTSINSHSEKELEEMLNVVYMILEEYYGMRINTDHSKVIKYSRSNTSNKPDIITGNESARTD